MKGFSLPVAATVTATTFLFSAVPAPATVAGENGRIAYRAFLNEEQTRAALFTIRPDGSEKRRVTHPIPGVLHLVPDWSPDARWIAFVRANSDWETSDLRSDWPRIFRIHPNGEGRENLSTNCTGACRINDDPAWSPNGEQIAFTRAFGDGPDEVDLMLMQANGTNVRHITNYKRPTRYEDWSPQWAPSGKRLVFHRVDKDRELSAIFTIRPDGGDLRRLTPWKIDAGGEPDWAPNGRWILYRDADGIACLIHPNGDDRHCITDTHSGQFEWGSGSFSPDETKIIFSRRPGVGPGFDVFRMNLDGSGLVNVTATSAWDGTPDWGTRRR